MGKEVPFEGQFGDGEATAGGPGGEGAGVRARAQAQTAGSSVERAGSCSGAPERHDSSPLRVLKVIERFHMSEARSRRSVGDGLSGGEQSTRLQASPAPSAGPGRPPSRSLRARLQPGPLAGYRPRRGASGPVPPSPCLTPPSAPDPVPRPSTFVLLRAHSDPVITLSSSPTWALGDTSPCPAHGVTPAFRCSPCTEWHVDPTHSTQQPPEGGVSSPAGLASPVGRGAGLTGSLSPVLPPCLGHWGGCDPQDCAGGTYLPAAVRPRFLKDKFLWLTRQVKGNSVSLKPAEAVSRVPFAFRHCGGRDVACEGGGAPSLQSPPPQSSLGLDIHHCGAQLC